MDPGSRVIQVGKVTDIARATRSEALVVAKTLRVTPEHPIWTSQGWKPAAALQPGDELLTPDGPIVLNEPPVAVTGEVEVYDLSVSSFHTFFADGILVHNKQGFD